MFLQDVGILVVVLLCRCQVIKYVLYLRLCGGGCVSNMLGIGPGFVSMSPLLSNISDLSNE